MRDLLKRFYLVECSPSKTLISNAVKLDVDNKGKSINITFYIDMVGSDGNRYASDRVWRNPNSNPIFFTVPEPNPNTKNI